MENLVIGLLAALVAHSELRRWCESRAAAGERRELCSRIQAGSVSEYEALRPHSHAPAKVRIVERPPSVEELAALKVGQADLDSVGSGEATFRKLMGEGE